MSSPNDPGVRETLAHIGIVRGLLARVIADLTMRSAVHDASKLESPEVEVFEELTPKLAQATYGSPEYKQFLVELGPALRHHYQVNRHHPEFFPRGILDMSLIDLVEMLCDWKAATLRHKDGDVRRSIAINQARFGYSDELRYIFLNTLPLLEVDPK